MWEKINVCTDSNFFNVFQKIIKQITNQKEITVKIPNQIKSNKRKELYEDIYKFVIEYQDDNADISGIEVYKQFKE